jgi:hypothetical protein
VVGMIVEAAAGRPLHQLVREIMIAAGFENKGYITTGRQGVPAVMGSFILATQSAVRSPPYFEMEFSMTIIKPRGGLVGLCSRSAQKSEIS